MSEITKIPHIRTPRSLLENNLWKDLSPDYMHVFNVLLEHVLFHPMQYDDHGVLIKLEVGQWCGTFRELAKLCGKYGDKNVVERSIKKFILYDFVRLEVRHRKSIITISHKDTYELIKRAGETRSETILRQDQDKIETQTKNIITKELKKTTTTPLPPKVVETAESKPVVVVSSYDKNKFEQRPARFEEPQLSRPSVVNLFEEIEKGIVQRKHSRNEITLHEDDKRNIIYTIGREKETKPNKNHSINNKNKQKQSKPIDDPLRTKTVWKLRNSGFEGDRLTDQFINDLMQDFTDEIIDESIKHAIKNYKKIFNLPGFIKKACQDRWKPVKSKEDIEIEKQHRAKNNQMIVKKYDGIMNENKTTKIICLSKGVEFSFTSQMEPKIVTYEDSKFLDIVSDLMKKCRFNINLESFAKPSNLACVALK
jgi:hypothetical protein